MPTGRSAPVVNLTTRPRRRHVGMQLETTAQHESNGTVATLRVDLLGGFAVEREGIPVPDFAWQRRSARRLTKLLATVPNHALHREQILEIFWPNADVDSAR